MDFTTGHSLDAFKSPNDAKEYRVLTLPNGLEALIIRSDVHSKIPHSATATSEVEPEPENGEESGTETDELPRRSLVSRSGGYNTESDSDSDSDADNDETPIAKGTPLAAACLSVGVGSMSDPPALRGLAHYLEHMLFMGSTAYPDENAFESFLSAHGGDSNGMTECESTRFVFEIAPAFLEPALDMFAQCFISPLFRRDAMARELHAIESEFNRARHNDYVRLQQVQCETCVPGHPYNSFSWGNTKSLDPPDDGRDGQDVRAEMIKFYQTYYQAHRMKLCVYGEHSLDEMEQWIRASFGAVPTTPQPTPSSVPIPFGVAAGQAPTLIKIIPVRKMHALHLYWPMPPLLNQYRQKPWEVLSHAMGHEADGSLSAILKDRMWATEVAVGISENDAYEFGSFGSLFEVNVTLTSLGLENWEAVVALVFEVVAFVRAAVRSSAYIFHELQAASRMHFQFQEESHPLSLCRRLAELLQDRHGVTRADLLRYDVVQGDYEPEKSLELMDWMTPANTRVLLLSPSFEKEDEALQWRREKWLDVQYTVEPIATATLQLWATSESTTLRLSLPEPNPFMPDDFTVLPIPIGDGADKPLDPDAEPMLVHATAVTKLWYKRDLTFHLPKTNANFLLCLPSLTRSVTNYVHAKLYLRLCHEALQHVQYQSSLAGYAYDLSLRDLDIETTFSGFSDKLPTLIHAVIHALLHTAIDDAVFQRVRVELVKEYKNLTLKPAVKARYLRLQLLERTAFPVEEKLSVLETVCPEDVRHFQQHVLWQCAASVRTMVHGNITLDAAVALVDAVENAIVEHTREQLLAPLPSPLRPHTTALPFTPNGLLLRDVSDHDNETNSIVEVYYQIGRGDFQDLAYAELLQHVMAEPLFHELRTTQQLGYEVYCMVRETHGVLGFSLSVQSASHAAGDIALRVDQFIHVDFVRYLEALPALELAKHVASLQRMKTREDATLGDETDRYWEEIQSRRLEFRIDDHVVKELLQCSVAGLRARYQHWLLAASETEAETESESDSGTSTSNSKVRKLRVHVIGKNSKFVRPLETLVARDEAPHVIDDWRAYKAALLCHCVRPQAQAQAVEHHHHHNRLHTHSHHHPRSRSRSHSHSHSDIRCQGRRRSGSVST